MHTLRRFTYPYKIIILFLLLMGLPAHAAPKLTVVIVVDGLSTQSLHEMRTFWPEGGLRTLSEEAYQTTVTFPHLVYGGDETTATMLTGVMPNEHGLTMDQRFYRSNRRIHPSLEDLQEHGIGSDLNLSPRALMAPTISDELRLNYGNNSKIYAIGIHPTTALILAGHSADACCWINPSTDNGQGWHWAGTSFYRHGLPAEADQMNISGRFGEIVSKMWTPRMDVSMYNHPTDNERKNGFTYNPSSDLTHTPNANELVVELALQIQQNEQMGKDIIPDMLLLEMSTLSPAAQSDRIESAEQEDMYLWLNQHMGYLIEQLQRRVGNDNLEILVLGRPTLGINPATMNAAGMNVQAFNIEHAAALTSTYLMALYGHERWIDGGYGQSIYLNRTLIEQKRMSLETMQRQVANFLMEFEGVRIAYPVSESLHEPTLRNSFNKTSMGDVLFTLQTGWQLNYGDNQVIDRVIEHNPTSPVLFWSGYRKTFPTEPLDVLQIKDLIVTE